MSENHFQTSFAEPARAGVISHQGANHVDMHTFTGCLKPTSHYSCVAWIAYAGSRTSVTWSIALLSISRQCLIIRFACTPFPWVFGALCGWRWLAAYAFTALLALCILIVYWVFVVMYCLDAWGLCHVLLECVGIMSFQWHVHHGSWGSIFMVFPCWNHVTHQVWFSDRH